MTVEHLLAHRSGIGDYLDEDIEHDHSDYLMPVPVRELAETEQFLAVLDGFPTKFPAGEQFSYCNGGFMVLALIAERSSGVPFHELVQQRVCDPAGMIDTAFLRSDELPGRAALGYLEVDGVWRTNVFHIPVRGNGDGGIYTTVADVRRLWLAFFEGRIVPPEWVAEMVRPRSVISERGAVRARVLARRFWRGGAPGGLRHGCVVPELAPSIHRLTHTVIGNDIGWRVADDPALLRAAVGPTARVERLRLRQEVDAAVPRPGPVLRAASSGQGRRHARSATSPSTYCCEPVMPRSSSAKSPRAPHAHRRRLDLREDQRRLDPRARVHVGAVPVERRGERTGTSKVD